MNLKNGIIVDPSSIDVGAHSPSGIMLRSVFSARQTHFGYSEIIKGGFFVSVKSATEKLEAHRYSGVGFLLERVPIILFEYQTVSIGVLARKNFSKSVYERLLMRCKESWPNFWAELPILDKDWLVCVPIVATPLSDFQHYKQQAYRSYFLGSDFPIQWEDCAYPHEKDFFLTFIDFFNSIKSYSSEVRLNVS